MSGVSISYIGEGLTDAAVARKLISAAGAVPGIDYTTPRRGRGKDNLDNRLAGLNKQAEHGYPVLALRDLDNDEPCGGVLADRLLLKRAPLLCLRIAVRSIESWILADYENFGRFIGVRPKDITPAPEALIRPKDHILQLVQQSTKQQIKKDLLPARNSGISVGPLFGSLMSEFVEAAWNPERAVASGRAPSLEKALLRVKELVRLAQGRAK